MAPCICLSVHVVNQQPQAMYCAVLGLNGGGGHVGGWGRNGPNEPQPHVGGESTVGGSSERPDSLGPDGKGP